MGYIEVSDLTVRRGMHELFHDASFRVGKGEHTAIVGSNGVGKSTLLQLIAASVGTVEPPEHAVADGVIRVDGSLVMMRQFIGTGKDAASVDDVLISLLPKGLRVLAEAVQVAERRMTADPSEEHGMAYATALERWGAASGYAIENGWDTACSRAIGISLEQARRRSVETYSGGEQKRLALEVLLTGEADVILLDEPDNYLDLPAKRWLEERLVASKKTVLFVSHDRKLLGRTAHRIVTIETAGAWTHGGSFSDYYEARRARHERLEDEHRRWAEERKRLDDLRRTMKQRAVQNDANASRARAAETRLRHFDERVPVPTRPRSKSVSLRLEGARSGKQVLICEQLELLGLTDPFDLDVYYGDRLAIIGRNGTGKSHFLRLVAGEPVEHEGAYRIGASVVVGYFDQKHRHGSGGGLSLLDVLAKRDIMRGPAMAHLSRYGLERSADQPFASLSGGQQARFQILELELGGANFLLLDEPTDNLDLESAEALEAPLERFRGTVIAVTHDRWFMRGFDRFLVIELDGSVRAVPDVDEALGLAGCS